MGLVIFAPTPSFACEKMRLLLTHTRCMHTFGPTKATVYALFIDNVMLLYFFSFSLLHTFILVISPIYLPLL